MLNKKSDSAMMQKAIGMVVSLLLALTSLAALAGVYKTHFLGGGATFGTTTASLSIIAFAISMHVWHQCMCCPNCRK